MIYTIKIRRDARCVLEREFQIDADTREEAEQEAIVYSETALSAEAFTVVSVDLSAVEGSSEVVE